MKFAILVLFIGLPLAAGFAAGRPTTRHDIAAKLRAVVCAWDPAPWAGP
jgi:hypothetical protein